jgi:competence protein ComFC
MALYPFFQKQLKIGQDFFHALIHIIYPRLCILCWKSTPVKEDYLCVHCMVELPFTIDGDIPFNNVSKHFFGRLPLNHAAALLNFYEESQLRVMLFKLKYRGKRQVATYLGREMAYKILTLKHFGRLDAIVPVPLHWRKEKQRGYNQSVLIAKAMSDVLEIPVLNDVLVKVEHNTSQTRKSRSQRLVNVDKVYLVQNLEKIKNKSILIVDDVVTTGATIEACGLELLKAQPESLYVYCAAVAR